MLTRAIRLIVLVGMIAVGNAHASQALNQDAVHKDYENGDFDAVIQKIDSFQKQNPTYFKSDSLFIAKHLSVVYAANPKSVEVGKYWMYQLLSLMPAADLAGMYVNEEIDRIFEKVRREFIARQVSFGIDTTRMVLPQRMDANSATAKDSASKPKSSPPVSVPPQKGKQVGDNRNAGRKKLFWIGAGGTALIAAVTTYVAMSSEPSTKTVQKKVPVDL